MLYEAIDNCYIPFNAHSNGAIVLFDRLKFSMLKTNRLLYFTLFITAILLSACSTRKNKKINRAYHAMTARYNVYFNGQEAFNEGLRNYEINLQEDFEKILSVRKMGSESDATSLFPDMELVIEKCTKSIKKHSMKIKGKERNSWIDNSFLLLGKAHFFKQDFVSAQTVFNHTTTLRGQDKVIDARIWSAECQVQLGNHQIAEANLEHIIENYPLDNKQKLHLLEVRAELYKRINEFEAAALTLTEALELTKKREKRARYYFIIGQLYQKVDENKKSKEYFQLVEKTSADYELVFNSLLYQARAYDSESGGLEEITERLIAMADDPKNKDYQDQIYYALGIIYQNDDNLPVALENFETSLNKNIDNTNQLIRSHLSLGDIKFDLKQYQPAQKHFDEVMNLITDEYPSYRSIKGKWNSLTELSTLYTKIEWNDSLKLLYGLTEAEQSAIVNEWILAWEEEELARKEDAAKKLQQLENKAKSKLSESKKDGNNWYFSNPGLITAGKKLFIERWGNRGKEDHWRRKNKEKALVIESDDIEEESDSLVNGESGKLAQVLAEIPKTEEEFVNLLEENAEAYYQLGMIYKEQLIDMKKSESSFVIVVDDYENYSRIEAVWYQLFRIYSLTGLPEEAAQFKQMILDKDPDSQYAKLANNEALSSSEGKVAEDSYNEAFIAFESGDYTTAIAMAEDFTLLHEKHLLLPRYALLKSFSIGAKEGKAPYILALNEVKAQYPNSLEGVRAMEILSVLEGNKDNFDLSAYDSDLNTQYFFIAIVDRGKSKMSKVTGEMSNFNKQSFKSSSLTIKELVYEDELSIVSVKLFDGAVKAMKYLEVFEKSQVYKQTLKNSNAQIFVISSKNYTTLYKRKNIKEYEAFYDKYLAGLK